MRRTSIGVLVILAVLAGAVGWLGQVALTASGSPSIVPPRTLIAAAFVLAGILVAVGWPIRQAVRGKWRHRLDPFVATRVLVFAKAASPTGALLTGAAAGLLGFALTRGVAPATTTLVLVIGSIVAALVLTVAGLLVESWCRVPPRDDDRSGHDVPAVRR